METKINVAEILKDKAEGTKLWTDMFGSVTLYVVTDACDAFQVKHHNKEPWFDKDGKLYKEGVLCIYPSKSMRDWSKFAWKKGDVLVNSRGLKILFDRWANGNYTSFYAKTINLVEDGFLDTNLHTLASEEEAKSFIKCIEERFGGKLNPQTLEIQKQPEFKDEDIVVTDAVPSMCYSKCIFILKGDLNTGESRANSYIFYNIKNNHISFDVLDVTIKDCNIHLATEEEKQQLFSALAKEGKAWDAEKKQIVDLKPKCEFKPFDKVLSRRCSEDYWVLNFYSHKTDYYHICIDGSSNLYCIPYNEETAHLLGTTDDWEGGEQ